MTSKINVDILKGKLNLIVICDRARPYNGYRWLVWRRNITKGGFCNYIPLHLVDATHDRPWLAHKTNDLFTDIRDKSISTTSFNSVDLPRKLNVQEYLTLGRMLKFANKRYNKIKDEVI